jgi:hypothetical protein
MDIDFLPKLKSCQSRRVSLKPLPHKNFSPEFVGCPVRYSDVGQSRIAVRVSHELRVFSRGEKGVVDELSCRRSRFQPGNPVCLANDQEWTFPAPRADSEFAVESAEAEYLGLIHAVQEAEDQSERRLAELALAIFLIGLNYQLSSTDLANLFTFQPRSQELADSQYAFESLARDHILSLARRGEPHPPVPSSSAGRRPPGCRALAWLRSRGLMPKWLPSSRNGEVLS